MHHADEPKPRKDSDFADALKKGVLTGAVLVLLTVAPYRVYQARQAAQQQPPAATQMGAGPAQQQAAAPSAPAATLPGGTAPAQPPAASPALLRADFRGEQPSADARHVADWVVFTRDNARHAFVVVDKKDARVYVFAPDGKLKDSAPALLGSARGDDSFPGIGEKPLKLIKSYEKTTPAGRFVAEPGVNANNEDIVWVDYDAAVSMHRIRPTVAKERRLERLATLTVDDNRISFGCINLPVSFYENVLSATVNQLGAIVYVLPETRSPKKVFGSFDVDDPAQVAAWKQSLARQASTKATKPAAPKTQKVSLSN
jgi:hypothetical protein